jgi:hypothetical protein
MHQPRVGYKKYLHNQKTRGEKHADPAKNKNNSRDRDEF